MKPPTLDDYKRLFGDIRRADDVAAEKLMARWNQLYTELSAEDQTRAMNWLAEIGLEAGIRLGYEAGLRKPMSLSEKLDELLRLAAEADGAERMATANVPDAIVDPEPLKARLESAKTTFIRDCVSHAADVVRGTLDSLTPEERLRIFDEILGAYCRRCGFPEHQIPCGEDEDGSRF